ncbi:MAG: hypothetical protein MJ164_00555 [Alphaproteobacteria bacterium]|nr:hypothetical protein [Alphaproteobacteria bacterium]
MKKVLFGIFGAIAITCSGYAEDVELLPVDTSDPLYMLEDEHLLSVSDITYGDDLLRLGQSFSYGLNNRLMAGANVHYQFDFVRARKERGFSSIELTGAYRAGLPDDNSANVSTDILFGARFGGNRHVREPDFAKSSYFAGLRVGRQWAGLTLSGTVKSTWVFDDTRGVSYIDFMPEAYFRMVYGWRAGIGFTARVATSPEFDREWWKFKLVKQFGRTQYGAMYSYEYEEENSTVGLYVNILF